MAIPIQHKVFVSYHPVNDQGYRDAFERPFDWASGVFVSPYLPPTVNRARTSLRISLFDVAGSGQNDRLGSAAGSDFHIDPIAATAAVLTESPSTC